MTAPAKTTRAEDLYHLLKQEIRNNALPPSHQATEPELALHHGVSRTTVREALIRLEADGLVSLVPRRGARVLPIRAEDMREIYAILTALEAEAVGALARRAPSRQVLQPLTDATEQMQDAVSRGALEDWATADDLFHTSLLDLHGNRRLVGIAQALFDQAHRARMATLRLRDIPRQSTQDHQDILDALLDGAAERAQALLRAHRQRAAAELLDILEKLPQL